MRYKQRQDIAWNELDNKVIAMSFTPPRALHELNESASFMFRCLKQPRNLEDLVSLLIQEFDVNREDALLDIREFLVDGESKNLLMITDD